MSDVTFSRLIDYIANYVRTRRRQWLTVDSARMLRSSKDMAAVLALVLSWPRWPRRCLHRPRAHAVRGRCGPRQRGGVRTRLPSPRAGPGHGAAALDRRRARASRSGTFPLGPLTLDRGDPRRARAGRGRRGRHGAGTDRARIARAPRSTSSPTGRRTREVELWSEPFRAGDGRLLGVRCSGAWPSMAPRGRGWPAAGDRCSSCSCPRCSPSSLRAWRAWDWGRASAVALATLAFECALLWPSGLVHSRLRDSRCARLLCRGLAPRAGLRPRGGEATCRRRRRPRSWPCWPRWLVQVVAGTSPVMVVSDAVFHANKLAARRRTATCSR